MSKVVKKATSVVKGVFGGGGSAGALGTGRFKGSSVDIDKSAFQRKLADDANQKAFRERQMAQTQRLEDRATGAAPSIAEAQLKAATNRSLAQQLAASQAQRGGSSAARERQLMKSQGQARREVAESSSVARLQEQQAAEQALAQQLQQQRATDINLAQSDRASEQALQDLLVKQNLGIQGINQQGFSSAAQQRGNIVKNIGSGLAAAFSDEDKKKNIKKDGESKLAKFAKGFAGVKEDKEKDDSNNNALTRFAKGFSGDKKAVSKGFKKIGAALSDEDKKKQVKKNDEKFNSKSFLDALQSYTYEYKNSEKSNPLAGEGKRLSVMAQDLEKAGPVGRSMVINTPEGKVVDYGRGFGAILAAQAELNKRLKEVEKKKK